MLLPNYGGPGQNFQRLIDAYKPREIVAVYMHFLTGANINDGNNGENELNGKKYHYGMRIDLMARLCKCTAQDTEAYGLKHIPQFGDRWVMEGAQKDEDTALAKIKTWWEAHQAEYAEKPAATQAAPPSAK